MFLIYVLFASARNTDKLLNERKSDENQESSIITY